MGNSQKALDEQVIKAYHFIQSFAPTDEVTPEEAHQIGMDFMKKTFDDRYAFLCSTHVDKNHIHNHFVMCSASRDILGRKLDDNLSLLLSLRKNNDILCKEHGLSVIEKEKGKSQTYKEWLAEKENPTGSNKTKIRKIIDRTVMEANDFDHFLFLIKAQEEKKQLRKEQAALRKALLSPAERKLDKSKVKIRSIREQSFDNISKDSIGKLRWTNKQNAMRFEQISLEVKEKYGIAYSDIKGHISSLRADNNRLSTQITKSKKDLEELRSFVENCVAYKRYKIYSINEEKASDKEKYYEAHDSQLDAFHDAVFALERRNIDLDSITYEGIKIMQQKVTEAETEIKRQEDINRQNERDLKELSDYQKEIDLYFGRMNDEI